jgi:DNA recombination protein RmuC
MSALTVLVLVLGTVNLAAIVLVLRRLSVDTVGQTLRDEFRASRDDQARSSRELRQELSLGIKGTTDSLVKTVGELGQVQSAHFEAFAGRLTAFNGSTHDGLEKLRGTVELQLKEIRDGNAKELQQIRKTVDDQLQSALERRLTESFKVVSDHLEAVQRGLGEMRALANGVGDLQRVLTNVKSRGTWAEYQLEALLQDILTPEQYGKNVATRPDADSRVEFAVRMPGRSGESAGVVWLPIDSKFPQEPYARTVTAVESGDPEEIRSAVAALAQAVRVQAHAIREKYVAPPYTTDIAVMFLPTEGLYAEVLRIPGLAAELQNHARVLVAGPTTLAALLSSLRVGFQTLAIEKRATEVWNVLRAVKTEFGKFGGVLDKLRKQLERATRTIDFADQRSRAMERRLREVEALPDRDATELLQLPEESDEFEDEFSIEAAPEPVGVGSNRERTTERRR